MVICYRESSITGIGTYLRGIPVKDIKKNTAYVIYLEISYDKGNT